MAGFGIMGCDYYSWIDTVIEYIDLSGIQQSAIDSSEKEAKYIYYGDSDFEKPYDLNEEIESYGKRYLYENNTWLGLSFSKQRIQQFCTINNIPFDRLVSVFKVKNGYVR